MRLNYKSSYSRSIKRLDPNTKSEVAETVCKIIDFYSTGIHSHGLGIKHLRKNYWEGRSGLKMRVLFRLHQDLAEFILAGNHDDISRYLTRI